MIDGPDEILLLRDGLCESVISDVVGVVTESRRQHLINQQLNTHVRHVVSRTLHTHTQTQTYRHTHTQTHTHRHTHVTDRRGEMGGWNDDSRETRHHRHQQHAISEQTQWCEAVRVTPALICALNETFDQHIHQGLILDFLFPMESFGYCNHKLCRRHVSISPTDTTMTNLIKCFLTASINVYTALN